MATSDTTSNWSYKNTDRSNNNNNASKQKPNLPFYPAFCFRASATHFAWVKMGAADVHRLTRRLEYGGSSFFRVSLALPICLSNDNLEESALHLC
jgi:hypothetical protein